MPKSNVNTQYIVGKHLQKMYYIPLESNLPIQEIPSESKTKWEVQPHTRLWSGLEKHSWEHLPFMLVQPVRAPDIGLSNTRKYIIKGYIIIKEFRAILFSLQFANLLRGGGGGVQGLKSWKHVTR